MTKVTTTIVAMTEVEIDLESEAEERGMGVEEFLEVYEESVEDGLAKQFADEDLVFLKVNTETNE